MLHATAASAEGEATHSRLFLLEMGLQVARQFDQLSDATLTAAILQTVFAASITSDEPTEEVLAGLLTPQEQARLSASGISPWDAYVQAQSSTAAQLAQLLDSDIKRWTEVIQKAGIPQQ